MLPPGFEPGSRTDPVLTRYKRAALPVELQEPISSQNQRLQPGFEPGIVAPDAMLTLHFRAAFPS